MPRSLTKLLLNTRQRSRQESEVYIAANTSTVIHTELNMLHLKKSAKLATLLQRFNV